VKLVPIVRHVTCDVDRTDEVSIKVEEAIDIKDEIWSFFQLLWQTI